MIVIASAAAAIRCDKAMYQPPRTNQITFSTQPRPPVPRSLAAGYQVAGTISLPNGQKAKPAIRYAAPA